MSELDDDNVVGLHDFDDLVKAAFTGVEAGATATDGFVDDGEGEGVGKEDVPAFAARSEGGDQNVRLGKVPVIAPFALAIVESPARYTVCALQDIEALKH